MLVALQLWLPKLSGRAVTLTQADSTVALALTQRWAGKSPALNYIGAELGIVVLKKEE